MAHPAALQPAPAADPLPRVVEGELVLDDTSPLQRPPAVRPRVYTATVVRRTCACGKDGTPYSHGGFSCAEVLEIAARVQADVARQSRPGLLARPLRRGGA